MPRRGKRKRLARGIYEDKSGRAGIYRDASGRQREVRFPPHTALAEIRVELDRLKAKHRGSGRLITDRGTLNAAINRWNGLEQHLASWKERRAELRAWAALYGERRLTTLTSDDVRKAMSAWTRLKLAPKTIRNRLWTLKHLYKVLHGPDVETPVDHVEPPAKVRVVINPTPDSVILTVYQNLLAAEQRGELRDAKTRARFMVRAASGRRPVEIMRAEHADVDLERRIWRVRDAKGGWSEGLYLFDDLLEAWSVFVAADAWGPFNTGSQARVLRAAGWPAESRPYNLRHSTGIGLSERGVDFADVAGWLGHRDVRTTREAYVPVLNSRMERAGKLLDGRFGGWVPVPVLVPVNESPQFTKPHQIKDAGGRAKRRQNAG